MKRILFALSLSLIGHLSAKPQLIDNLIIEENVIIKELSSFIDTVKPHSIGNGKYNVYVLHLFSDSQSNKICFTIGYIMNSSNYKYIKPQYFFKLEEEFILVRYNQDLLEQNFNFTLPTYQKIGGSYTVPIVQKLFPSDLGGITGITRGLVYCSDGINYHKVLYDNSDQIPIEKSIYASFPTGGVIELIPNRE
jgi:hypothetical protein